MAQQREPFRGFARSTAEGSMDRGAALLDTAAVRAARVNHVGGTTASVELPVVSAEAAAAILNATTPITASLPRVEAAPEVSAPVASSPAPPSSAALGSPVPEPSARSTATPVEALSAASHEPLATVADAASVTPLLESFPLESSEQAQVAPEAPSVVSAPESPAVEERLVEIDEVPSLVVLEDTAAPAMPTPVLEAASASESEELREPEPEPEPVAEVSSGPEVAAEPRRAQMPPRAAQRGAPVPAAEARVSSSTGDFELFATTASATAPPAAQTPATQTPARADRDVVAEPAARVREEAPELQAGPPAGGPDPVQPSVADDSIVVLEEPVLITGGEIIRPRTMHAQPHAPAPAARAASEPATSTQGSRDDLARASDPSVDGQELMALATHRRAAVRAAVAARPDLPATVVVFLSRDHSSEVLTSLLHNTRIPSSTVRYLADHRDPRVADLAVQRLRNDFR